MNITFLAHSGFLAETEKATLLFDYYQGEIPEISNEKPLIVFASHVHHDHFNREKIFALDSRDRRTIFVFGHDIHVTDGRKKKWGIAEDAEIIRMNGEEAKQLLPDVSVETCHSTDEGVSFLVTSGEETIYHAGDLNYWYWEKDTDAVNRERGERFRNYSKPLLGKHIDVAMIPVDPRQHEFGYLTAEYYLDNLDMDVMIPMHQWEDFDFTDGLLRRRPKDSHKIRKVEENGQKFTF